MSQWFINADWLKPTVRFIVEDHGIRVVNAMSRDILGALKEPDIQVASATFELTGLPPLRMRDAARLFDKRLNDHHGR